MNDVSATLARGRYRATAPSTEKMFKTWLSPLSLASTPALQRRIKGLSLLSENCLKQNIHPAQGLRISRRCFEADYELLLSNPGARRAGELVEQIKRKLENREPTPIITQPADLPEHFLLKTQLPRSLTRVKGYLAPFLDVQPDIHFVRTQRRYNKRRYARVRATSRPSF